MNMIYADVIEWWENEDGNFNWHATSEENGKILFGSVQGYSDKATLLRYVSQQFPEATIRPRDGEPQSSSEVAKSQLGDQTDEAGEVGTFDEEPQASQPVHQEDDGA